MRFRSTVKYWMALLSLFSRSAISSKFARISMMSDTSPCTTLVSTGERSASPLHQTSGTSLQSAHHRLSGDLSLRDREPCTLQDLKPLHSTRIMFAIWIRSRRKKSLNLVGERMAPFLVGEPTPPRKPVLKRRSRAGDAEMGGRSVPLPAAIARRVCIEQCVARSKRPQKITCRASSPERAHV